MSSADSSRRSAFTPPAPSQEAVEPVTAPQGEGDGQRAAPPALSPQHGQPDDPTVISQRPPAALRPAVPQDIGRSLVGQTLDHFELTDYVGGGGMGAVFRARDLLLKRDVAVKVLFPEQAADEETLRRFQNEAQSAARLDHENISRVFYVGQAKGLHYIVFEFIEGENLRDLVERRGALPIPEALSYTLQIAEALAHAAQREVVHRDIKPSNVIITGDGRAKLVDMGLARLHQPGSAADLTASGVTLGTFDYISPEQARDPRTADVRSDIYSLGCTLYFMLCERPPFPQGTVLQKLLQHSTDAPPDPREFNSQVPPEFAAVVRKMLAKEPRWRYQHPHDLIRDLLALAERWGLQGVSSRVQVAAVPAPRMRLSQQLPWLVPIAALLGLVAVLHALDARQGEVVAGAGRPLPSWRQQPPKREGQPSSSLEPRGGRQPAAGSQQPGRGADSLDSQPGPEATSHENRSANTSTTAEQPELAEPTPAASGASDPRQPQGSKSTAAQPADNGPASTSTDSGIREPAPSARGRMPQGAATTPLTEGTVPESQAATAKERSADAPSPEPGAGDAAPLPPGMLVVHDGPAVGPYYSSLQAAMAAAKNGEIIELRYTGVRDEPPITLKNTRLTLRAGEGHRPVVRFRPAKADPAKAQPAMLSLSGGRLTLAGLALELEVPSPLEVPVGGWTLLEAAGAELLELDRCWLTVRNSTSSGAAYHPNVAFFDVRSGLERDGMMMPDDMAAEPALKLRLRNCVARGEAVMVRVADGQPFDLSWDNGLLATTDRLLAVSGGATAPRSGGRIHLDLRHLTAAVGSGLVHIATTAASPYAPPCEIDCSNSLLVALQAATLIEHQSLEPAQRIQQQFNWSGERNVYEGFSVFWRIQDGSAMGPLVRSFGEWRSLWGQAGETQSRLGPVPWQRPLPVFRPTHTHVPADYLPDPEAAENPARQAASDGKDCGFDFPLLPTPPRADT